MTPDDIYFPVNRNIVYKHKYYDSDPAQLEKLHKKISGGLYSGSSALATDEECSAFF